MSRFPVFISLMVVCWTPKMTSADRLNIITLTSANATGSGTEQMLPTFSVALDDMKERYPLAYANYSKVDLFWGSNDPICRPEGDGMVPTKLAEWYSQGLFTRSGVTIILSAVCARAFGVVADFTRESFVRAAIEANPAIWKIYYQSFQETVLVELNLTIMACGTGVDFDPARSPHVVSLAQTSFMIFGQAVGLIMDLFRWRYIVVISDAISKTAGNGRNSIMCKGPLADLGAKRKDLQHIVLPVDSDVTGFSFHNVLKKASEYSNIILCCTMFQGMRRLLGAARDLNMTNGDCVFMYLYEGEVPYEPPLIQWKQNDELDEKISEALDAILLFRTRETNWKHFISRADQILRLREKLFNASYNSELLYNDFFLSCTAVAEVVSQVLTSVYLEKETVESAGSRYTSIVDKIVRRSFQLTFENVSVGADATKIPDVQIQQYDNSSGTFVNVYLYNQSTRKYGEVRDVRWKRGAVPVDRKLCNPAFCHSSATTRTAAVTIVSMLVVFIVLAVVFSIRRQQNRQEFRRTWWVVTDADFRATEIEGNQHLRKLKQALCVSRVALSYCSADTRRIYSRKYRQVVNLRGTPAFRKQLYWTSNKAPVCTNTFLSWISKMRKLESANINGLLGLHISDTSPSSFYAFCQRGSVEDFLQQTEPDWVLKMSLILDVIRGLKVLHESPIKKHGNLKSTKLLLDNHMAVKITDYGHEELTGLLGDIPTATTEGPYFPLHCWMAPEVMRGHDSTPESDIYAFGLIAHQIVMHCKVFNMGTHCALDPYEIVDQVQMGEMPYFRPTFPAKDTAAGNWLVALLKTCWDEAPTNRPTISAIGSTFRRTLAPEDMEGTLLERVVRWLTNHNALLEQDVADRTTQLLLEQRKADELLRSMLPSDVVKKLRTGLSIEAECVDDVSILFSDICGFNDFVATNLPLTVMTFLNVVYTRFDEVSAGLSVYKMETIGSSYMATSGLVERIGDYHADEICQLSKLLLKTFTGYCTHTNMATGFGVHRGPVAVGVVGLKRPRYCLFGDTVNTASRIQSSGLPSKIHVSDSIENVAKEFGHRFDKRGETYLKGKGSMLTYWLVQDEVCS